MAKVVVIDRAGRTLSSFPVHPASPQVQEFGMKYAEGLGWLTNQRIVVTGSVNPSTTEYDVFNSVTGQRVDQFFDDGLGAAFSPNGQHYAHITGSPHFTPGEPASGDVKNR